MSEDIRLSVEFFAHPKTVKLKRRLGADGVVSLLTLWTWCRVNRNDGVLVGMDTEDIEIAAQWSGEAGRFVNEAVSVRFIDLIGEDFAIHDWADHNTWSFFAEERASKARLSRLARANPAVYRELVDSGVKSISKQAYRDALGVDASLRNVNESLENGFDRSTSNNDRTANCLLQAPAPAPAPARSHSLSHSHSLKEKDFCASEPEEKSYCSKKGKKLKGKTLEDFLSFWAAFDLPKGKAEAADAWLAVYTESEMPKIIAGAKAEAARRPGIIKRGSTPKFPQGWLSARRWEDEDGPTITPDGWETPPPPPGGDGW